MIRLGIVGLGFGAAVQLPAFRELPGVQVVALGGRRPDKAKELADRMGIGVGGSIDDVLATPLDALSVALPPELGASVCLRALERGLAVLAEKPLAENAMRASLLAQRAVGRTAAVDFELADLAAFRALKQSAEGTQIKSVKIVWRTRSYAHEKGLWTWKTDRAQHGGVLNLLGSHVFFLLEWMFGPLRTLAARVSDERTRPLAPAGAVAAEDLAEIRATTQGGAAIDITLDNAATGISHRWDVVLDGASLAFVAHPDGSFELAQEKSGSRLILASDPVVPGIDWRIAPFRRLAARFIESASRGESCFPGFDTGARVQRLLDAVRESSERGGANVGTQDLA